MKRSTWRGCVIGCALGLIVGLSAIPAQALTLGIHTFSYHSEKGYNNTNPGVYLEHNGYTIGTYYNSERHQTYYVGYTYGGTLYRGLEYGLSVGVASGYERAKLVPLVVPSVAYRFDSGFGVRLSGIPPVGGIPGVLHLSLEQRF